MRRYAALTEPTLRRAAEAVAANGRGRRASLVRTMMGGLQRQRVTSLVVGMLFVMLASEAASQAPTVPEQPLIIEGRVLWIDFGNEMMVLEPDNGGPSITIDLHRIRQSNYHGFRGNEYVRVVGFILRPSRRIQAFELYRVTPWFPTEPLSP